MTDAFWKPPKEVKRAISRGDRKVKEAYDRLCEQAEAERKERRDWLMEDRDAESVTRVTNPARKKLCQP